MDIHFFARTDMGRVRTANEDFFLSEKISPNEFLFIVADGMGGHQAGDVASKLASESFSEAYKALRKKGIAIMESMEAAVRKANMVVFEKAAADIEKRGMGTTFSALVTADMRAFIAHVGDSRIYLIRKSKIRKLTTDHSFVEKLVEEGRISPEEAREHPQKNVLYMSLGARENLMPELVNAMPLEDGDALVLCSDGLSNMVTDDNLLKTVVDYYPEDAANFLVKAANANGGADNITLQIVRLGSLEMLEKTKPIKLPRSRKKIFAAIALLVLLAVLTALWYLFRNSPPARTKVPDNASAAFLLAGQNGKAPTPIREIDSSRLQALGLEAADCLFLAAQKLHFVKSGTLVVFNLKDHSARHVQLDANDQVVPAENGEFYLLRRSATLAIDYRLSQPDAPKPLLIIQADKQFDLKEMESKRGKIFKIANLKGWVVPDFINDRIFIFHDAKQYYGIKNWQTADGQQFPLPGLVFVQGAKLFFNKRAGQTAILYCQEQSGRISVLRLDNFEKLDEFQLPDLAPLLFAESSADHTLWLYRPDQYVEIRRGQKEIRREYHFNNFHINAVKLLQDLGNGQRLLINDGNKLFSLTYDP